ncbi:heterodisulfide reductase-related iron-sulfur binding cluster [Mycobacterium syngnathidarum]|uniref:Fe-S oxidoreductase n=1 Tax=Mycobacterium syngnathidarum TaxID=1908205 RepID=A0A1S1JWN3_9MYCO|nr:heterodisulfide reductase-related iron-sulfur binding cluster [Mycobacterium syngnathidarum]OHT93200.1 Fe-S oxidoreductase [Mycobacterium syngnathidarum]OLT97418.1 Fe-S oxidoreductase [Mycobacterium syngnathidarum]
MESLEHTLAVSRLILGVLATLVVLAFAGKRVLWLTKLISSGQKVGDERGRKDHLVTRFLNQNKEVFAQSKLLKWSIPGLAHFFTMWGFFVLATVYLEAYGVLFDPEFHIPLVGRWAVLGFLQDFFAVAVLAGIIVFAIIRIRKNPEQLGRESRFYGSHNGGAWTILIMIFLVIATYAVFRGAAVNVLDEDFPYQSGAFFSDAMAALLAPLGHTANVWLETIALLAHLGVMLAFLLIVLHSKHLHIGLAPINVTFKRLPDGLGPLLPMEYKGDKIDFEDPAEDAVFGKGSIEDFTWKANLDMATCTECGRCQSQCPAWNTGKPLSPKLVIMNLRDHLFAKAPYIIEGKPMPEEGSVDFAKLGDSLHGHGVPEDGYARIEGSGPEQALRPLVGTAEQGGVIDPDVLWSCTNCGACVEQCPVDIEHIDHIVDMRRYQVMVESEFPGELGVLFKNLETKGNPWGQNAKDRTNWIDEVDFDVPVYGEDVESFDGFEYLFWVGCAGAYEDRAKKTTKAVAELLAASGVKFLVLGTGETCTGDSARRSGNEFLFQQLAAQNVETINELFEGVETVDRKIIVTCPHCFNTIGREYPQLGANYTVVHHTQLLNRLVRDKKLVPVKSTGGPEVTYHDPCFLGRHNKVYEAPRELVEASGVTLKEMPRHADRGLCCGAGGARMWMEEHIGKRVNVERTEEAMDTASTIATGCPFCRVMITDGVDDVAAARDVEKAEVLDVAQLLLNSLDKSAITLPEKGTAAKESEKRAEARAEAEAKAAAAAPAPVVEEAPAAEEAPAPEAPAAPAAAPAPVKGLGMAGGAKRPGAKKTAAPAASAAPAEAPAAPAAPVKGLGIAGGAKRPGAKKTAAPAASAAPAAEPAAPAAPAAPVKGLGLAAGARRPGAKKAAPAASAAPAAPAAEAPAAEAPAEPAKPEPPVVGLGIAAGARRPGAKKAAKAAPAAPAPAAPAAEPAPESAAEKPAEAPAEDAKPEPPVVGLGIKPGAKRPGKR